MTSPCVCGQQARVNCSPFCRGTANLCAIWQLCPTACWLATGGVDRFLYLWDLASGKAQHILADQDALWLITLTFSPDSQTMAVYHGNETISFWAVLSGQRVDAYRLHYAAIHVLAFSPDGRFLVAGGGDSAVYLWDVSQPTQPFVTARLAGHRSRVLSVAFSSDGATLAIGDMGGLFRLWQRKDETHRIWASRTLLQTQESFAASPLAPMGRHLPVPAAMDCAFGRWLRVAKPICCRVQPRRCGRARLAMMGVGSPVAMLTTPFAFGRWIRSGDIALRHRLHQHTNFVQALLFSPDSRTLFSCSFDNTLCRWEVSTGTLRARWATHGTFYVALAIQPDGQRIASGGGDHRFGCSTVKWGAIQPVARAHPHHRSAQLSPRWEVACQRKWTRRSGCGM